MATFLKAFTLCLVINLAAYGLAHADEAVAPPTSNRPWFGVHFAAGFPNPAQVGLDFLSANETFGFSIRGGNIQRGVSGVDANLKNLEAQFRYHPWSSAFYYGVAVGHRSAQVEKTDWVSNQRVKATVEATSEYLTPQVGWVWMFNNGLNLGFELGYLLPLNPKTSFATDADASMTSQNSYKNLEKTVADQGDYLAKLALPHFTLIRLGWSY